MNWYKRAQVNILMTPSEKKWAEWAIDPMIDYWCSQEGAWERGEDNVYSINELPRIEGNVLYLSNISEINEDFLYRIEEQAQHVCETDASSNQQISARYKPALLLAKKIRKVL